MNKILKAVLVSVIMCASLFAGAQTKTVNISKQKILAFNCSYNKTIDVSKNDTSYYVLLSFQNQEYQTITDTRYIGLDSEDQLQKFIADLDSALAFNEDADMHWEGKGYEIYKFSKDKKIMFYDGETSRGWTYTNNNGGEKLSAWLKGISFGK